MWYNIQAGLFAYMYMYLFIYLPVFDTVKVSDFINTQYRKA